MTLLEAHKLALKVLKQVMEEKLDENNVQLAQVSQSPIRWRQSWWQVTSAGGFEILSEEKLKEVIEAIAA
jgi:20S proteasome subunit alpha 5